MTDKELIEQDKKTGAIAIADPLQRYLQEVHSFPMLKPEEEDDLARRFRDKGDIEAARKLVTTHLRLVAKIAMEYRSAYHNVLDLIQEGTVGLLTAVRHFDPDKGARLATYAQWWIRSYILKFILDNFRLIKIGTTKTQKKLFYNLMREKQRIEAMGYYATPEVLAKELNVPESEVIEMQKRLETPEYALEAPVGKRGEGEALLKDFIELEQPMADEQISKQQEKDILKEKLESFSKILKPREKKILQERLMAELPVTLQAIAEEYGITKERVRQIESRLIEKLKEFLKESGIEAEYVG